MKNNARSKINIRIAWFLLPVMLLAAGWTVSAPLKAYAMNGHLYTYSVKVESGYLALRTGKAYDKKNEIGELYTGDVVVWCPISGDESQYKYVYSPKLHKHGYVNKDYLTYKGEYDGATMYAKVDTGYLALRNGKSYNKNNEIGKLETGDSVVVLDNSDPTYWTVYAPTLYKTGYVNQNYLVGSSAQTVYQEPDFPAGMAVNSYGEWKWDNDRSDYLSIRMQVTNYSRTRTVSAFEIQVYAEDVWGDRVYGDKVVYVDTTVKTIKPGETVYSDYITIPDRSRIYKVYGAVRKVRLSDGSICTNNYISSSEYVSWVIED